MARIKLNLPTGVVEEKTLITAFENNGNKYVIFDADSVGSMGLPIILVCKINENRVVKIADQNEWNNVKTYLKDIIQGNSQSYVSLSDSMDADEVYFTQLTLPVASFETIKNAYVPVDTSVSTEVENVTVSEPVNVEAPSISNDDSVATTPQNIVNEEPVVENNIVQNSSTDNIMPESVVEGTGETVNGDEIISNIENEIVNEPVVEEPTNSELVMPDLTVLNDETSMPVDNSVVDPSPVVESNSVDVVDNVNTGIEPEVNDVAPLNNMVSDGISNKEIFLKACGELFDSLVNEISKNK